MAGEDRWFKLEPRSSASRVQGDCQLVLKLITTQVGSRGGPPPCVLAVHPCPRAWAGLVTGGSCIPEGHGHEPARAGGLPVLHAAAQSSPAVRAPIRGGSLALRTGLTGRLGRQSRGAWAPGGGGDGGPCLHPRLPPTPPAQGELLAGRAQRARGHDPLPARRAEQPVGAAAGCAVSGRGLRGRGTGRPAAGGRASGRGTGRLAAGGRGERGKESSEWEGMKGGGAMGESGACKGQVGGARGGGLIGVSVPMGGAPPDLQALAGQQPPPSDPDPGLRLPAGAAGGHAGALGRGVFAAPTAGELFLGGVLWGRWRWGRQGGVLPTWGARLTGPCGAANKLHDPG